MNRFYTYDVPARLQLFELKSKYSLLTTPNVDRYNLPYDADGNLQFQILVQPALCDGASIPLCIDRNAFTLSWPDYDFNENDIQGDGTNSTYSFNTSSTNLLRGHIDIIGKFAQANSQLIPAPSLDPAVYISALNADNVQLVVTDSGQFSPTNQNVGLLTIDGGNTTNAGTVDYTSGAITVNFPEIIPQGNDIQVKYIQYSPGTPVCVLLFNNIVQLRPVPSKASLIVFDAYLTPATFLSTSQALPFGYMTEYFARGAARKILSDVGDMEQFAFYEPLFREQECLVIRRTNRQQNVGRIPTIFSQSCGAWGGRQNWGGYGT